MPRRVFTESDIHHILSCGHVVDAKLSVLVHGGCKAGTGPAELGWLVEFDSDQCEMPVDFSFEANWSIQCSDNGATFATEVNLGGFPPWEGDGNPTGRRHFRSSIIYHHCDVTSNVTAAGDHSLEYSRPAIILQTRKKCWQRDYWQI